MKKSKHFPLFFTPFIDRDKVRSNHGHLYRPYKQIIATDTEIHHEWIPSTAKYRGIALVEANLHRHHIIDVIVILDGKITLLTEKEIRDSHE